MRTPRAPHDPPAVPATALRPDARTVFLITCEHGGNRIPAPYRHYFREHRHVLDSHRGYDPGALQLARTLASLLEGTLVTSTVSRLLVDLNRSLHHLHLHSAWIRQAPPAVRQRLVTDYYLPYRTAAEDAIAAAVSLGNRVLHLSCHSFTPVLDQVVRQADIGLLYDPGRPWEAALCREWQQQMARMLPGLHIRRNYPYRGTADGFTTCLRRRFAADTYAGIEIEINQKLVTTGRHWRNCQQVLAASLHAALADFPASSGLHS